jgi:hypothetical protein
LTKASSRATDSAGASFAFTMASNCASSSLDGAAFAAVDDFGFPAPALGLGLCAIANSSLAAGSRCAAATAAEQVKETLNKMAEKPADKIRFIKLYSLVGGGA